jgi:hypothetical protein
MLGIVTRKRRGAAVVGTAGAAFLCLLAILPALSTVDSLAMLDNNDQDDRVAAIPAFAPRCPTLSSNGRSMVPDHRRLVPPESDPSLPSRAPPRA